MEQHFILCGLGRVGERILEYLRAAGAAVTVIDDRCRPEDPRLAGARLVVGDCRRRETLEQAGLVQARGVVIAVSDDMVSLQTALMVRHLHPSVRVVVRLFNQNLLARLGASVSNVFALSTSALAAPLFAAMARTGEALGAFRVHGGTRFQVAECTVAPGSHLVGRPISEAAVHYQAAVVAHQAHGQDMRFLHEVDLATCVQVGDRLVTCAQPRASASLLAEGRNESLPELLWAGTVRRLGRAVARSWALIDWPVKVCTLVLVAVIVISVLVFYFGMKHDTLIDAFYRTISLIATGADMRGAEVEPGGWQKLYISALRLVGAALLAAFTAIFTNYLVRANLGGALEVRRVPDSGHVIVCGLGNIGYRVVEELLGQDELVVAIERNRDNPFIPTARRLQAPVIIGDATIVEVLKQANATAARAIVAATDKELVNLEIALLARQLNPRQRIVVRIVDPTLARTLRDAANVRLALSIPELAAPAFAAALFGDQVRSLVLVQGRLLAIYDFVAQERELVGRSLQELAAEYRCLPIHRLSEAGADLPLAPSARLAPGERLTVIMALSDLRRVLGPRDRP